MFWLGTTVLASMIGGSELGWALAKDSPKFILGLNLNGPPVIIDGRQWVGSDSPHYRCRDKAFENQKVMLEPPTDPERARMIRSSRWGGNRVELTELPNGRCTILLYVWEDNRPETYDVAINGQLVAKAIQSGKAGSWQRLGPWAVDVTDHSMVITSRGGAANFSGIEVWQGDYDGQSGAEFTEEQLTFFEERVRPILIDRCYPCHSQESGDVQGELLVDSRVAIRQGGASGPAVVPGNVEASLLIRAVRYQHAELQMPPDERLEEEEIRDLETWIMQGAADPRDAVTRYERPKIDLVEAKQFWSLQPLVRPKLPAIKDVAWPLTAIDHFILSSIEAHGLKPSPLADKRTLIRRATFDLIGLPPTPDEVDAFLRDDSPDAYPRLIDRLLESSHYGERWGRYWLDVVRYADTAGDNSDYPIPQMYRYRNWVIDSLNRDMPYDQFVRTQLAGDLLPYTNEAQRREQLIATGYIANSRRFGSRVSDYPQHLTIEDTLDNFGRVFLGLTLNCARCHDHKFDPISLEDYYGLYGIFSSTRYPWPGIELEQRQRDLIPLAGEEEVRLFLAEQAERQKQLDAEVKRLSKRVGEATEAEKPELEARLKEARELAKRNAQRPPPYELIYGVADAEEPDDAFIQLKGDPNRPGDVVRRGFLSVLGGQKLEGMATGSGRRQLAEWLFDSENPLPARVLVNRIWQQHFGRGLVPTPNDFGKQGKPPTHPELLDWLASELREQGWSMKRMHRQIMLSRTYQLSSQPEPTASEKDPSNTWLTAYPRRRIDAEALRDTLLFLGGTLDRQPAGPHPFPPQEEWKFTQHNPFKANYPSQKRSVYLMTQRIQRDPFLAIFDGADPSTSTPTRTSTTTPLQALFFLNDPLFHQQAKRFADRVLVDGEDDTARLNLAFEWIFTRPPTPHEMGEASRFLSAYRETVGGQNLSDEEPQGDDLQPSSEDALERRAWQALIRVLLRLNEFVYVD